MGSTSGYAMLPAGTALATALLFGGCATPVPKGDFTPPPIGSAWTNQQHNSGSYGTTSSQVTTKRGEQTWEGQRVIAYETGSATQLSRDNGKIVAFLNNGKPVASINPELGYQFPLVVGKSMTTIHHLAVPGKAEPTRIQVIQKVEAYEDVTVPAGTFKAFRISWSESIGNENTYWYSPQLGITIKSILTRTDKFSAGPGRRVSELVSVPMKQ